MKKIQYQQVFAEHVLSDFQFKRISTTKYFEESFILFVENVLGITIDFFYKIPNFLFLFSLCFPFFADFRFLLSQFLFIASIIVKKKREKGKFNSAHLENEVFSNNPH